MQSYVSRFEPFILVIVYRYQINAKTELAIRYNDQSPLENHHAAVCFQILSQPECNIFANVSEADFLRIRVGIIALILATDMARHAEILDKFKQHIDNFEWDNNDHITTVSGGNIYVLSSLFD